MSVLQPGLLGMGVYNFTFHRETDIFTFCVLVCYESCWRWCSPFKKRSSKSIKSVLSCLCWLDFLIWWWIWVWSVLRGAGFLSVTVLGYVSVFLRFSQASFSHCLVWVWDFHAVVFLAVPSLLSVLASNHLNGIRWVGLLLVIHHTYEHERTRVRACEHAHTNTCIGARARARIHAHTHIHKLTHKLTHAHTHTHTHTHTPEHTHTHTL